MKKSIILCGGGTAGHVMPNIALLPRLEKHFSKIYYMGSFSGIEKEIVSAYPQIEYLPITTVKLIRSFSFKNLLIPFKLAKGIIESKKIIKNINPNVIFSKGGYASLPVTYAGKKLKIPVIAHESDLTLGLANKLIFKNCTKMCCTFQETASSIGEKGQFTLSPIREKLLLGNKDIALKICNFDNNRSTILFMGGSLGAQAINQCVFSTFKELVKKYNVIHIVGKGNFNKKVNCKNYYQTEFVKEIEHFYALATIVIGRAGSNSISELLALNKPMLLIPLPKGNSRGDQVLNAEYFNKKGYATILEQSRLTASNLIIAIENLIKQSNKIKTNQALLKSKTGNENIINIILKFSK